MKKKIICILLSVMLCLGAVIPAYAAAPDCQHRQPSSAYAALVSQFLSWLEDAMQQQSCSQPCRCPSKPDTDAPQENPAQPSETPELPEDPVQPEQPVEPERPVEPECPVEPEQPVQNTPAQQVLALVNAERAKNNLSALTLSDTLSRYALVKSQDLHDSRYFDHTSPNYGSPFDMMRSFGITYAYAGENIAMGYFDAASVVRAWMNSDSHRANILSPNYKQMGIGYVADGGYWTQWFIG